MSDEGFEEWDAEFLDQLIQVEELALSASSSSAIPNHKPLPSLHRRRQNLPPPPAPAPEADSRRSFSYSPPRELSQRTGRSSEDRDLEIIGLKKELGRVSKQLSDLEQECSKLRSDRDKKNERLNNLSSITKERDGVSRMASLGEGNSCCKGVGVQADNETGFTHSYSKDDNRACSDSNKGLRDIWVFPRNQVLGRNMVSNLLVTCQSDLRELFACMGVNPPVISRQDVLTYESSRVVSVHHSQEASKVSQFYSMLTKINNGMVHLEDLLEPLLDLCSLENVIIIHRSLRIVHGYLKNLCCLERKFGERDNVTVEGLCSGKDVLNNQCTSAAEKKYLTGESLFEKRQWNLGIEWDSLFQIMLGIAARRTEEFVRVEVISIMNIILIRSSAYTYREKFCRNQVFECISQLLRKEAGLHVQRLSVQLLYLLLNCPKILVDFCRHCTEDGFSGLTKSIAEETSNSVSQNYISVLWGLADCISCSDNGLEELKLRRHVVVLLAFLASAGNSGFDILVTHKLYKDANFLMLIMQGLASEIDLETTSTPKSPEIFKERTMLMREALILVNRLVSNPAYSATALQMLTKTRDMASITIDIANRLSRKDRTNPYIDGVVEIVRNSEVVDLARAFQKRVFTYMGDHIS